MSAPRSTATKAAAKANQTGAELLRRIKPQRREESTQVCLRTDLIHEFKEADEELARLRSATTGKTNRLNPGTGDDEGEAASESVRAQARKVRKLEEQILDSQISFTFRGMNKDEWRAMTDDHPPRKDDAMDSYVGYNRDAVLDSMVRECLVSPVFEDCTEAGCTHEDCGTWQQLVSVINTSEWAELRDTANLANSGVVDAPKSELASQVLDKRGNA